MANVKKTEETNDGLTIQAAPAKKEEPGARVRIFLPKLEDEGNGITVDQYEHVTIANEFDERHYRIHRGEWVEIPVSVFVVMKQGKYPEL